MGPCGKYSIYLILLTACSSGPGFNNARTPASMPINENSCARTLIELSGSDRQTRFEVLIERSIRRSSFLDGVATQKVVDEALMEFNKAAKLPKALSRRRARKLLKGAFLLGHPRLKDIRTPFGLRVEDTYLNLLESKMAEKNLVEALKSSGLYKKSLFEQMRIPTFIRSHSANSLELGLSAALIVKFGVILPPALRIEFLPSKKQWEDIVDVLIREGPEAAKAHVRKHFSVRAHADFVYGHLQKVYVYATIAGIAYLSIAEFVNQRRQIDQLQAQALKQAQSVLSDFMQEPPSPEEAQRQLIESMLDSMESSSAAAGMPFDRDAERREFYRKTSLDL